jgi:cyclic nucleotide gated channel
VQILHNESEYLLRLICESLKPLYYNENSYIFREEEPHNAKIFITQGSLWCFKTNNGEGIASSPQCIEICEFYGEELLEWESNLPISTKTVKTLIEVEAFALTANKWKILLSRRSQAASIAKRFAQATRGCLNEKMNEIKFSQNGLA